MANLDDSKLYEDLDPSGMRARIRALADDCERAWRAVCDFPFPWPSGTCDSLLVGGMGGSAVAGDLVQDLTAPAAAVPITVARGFDLPYRCGPNSQVVLCSYSGNTEETLSLYRQALQAGARTVVIAGGGVLGSEADAAGVPMLRVETEGEPRSAVGYNLMLLLGTVSRLGVAETTDADVAVAMDALRAQVARLAPEVPTKDNPAKRLALDLQGKVVVVYGGGVLAGIARRWKTQLNENAGAWSFCETVPELLHNAIEAYGSATENIIVVALRPRDARPELDRKCELAVEMLRRNGVSHRSPEVAPGGPLAQVLTTLALGDWASYYLALLNGTDPSPTPAIRLGRSGTI